MSPELITSLYSRFSQPPPGRSYNHLERDYWELVLAFGDVCDAAVGCKPGTHNRSFGTERYARERIVAAVVVDSPVSSSRPAACEPG